MKAFSRSVEQQADVRWRGDQVSEERVRGRGDEVVAGARSTQRHDDGGLIIEGGGKRRLRARVHAGVGRAGVGRAGVGRAGVACAGVANQASVRGLSPGVMGGGAGVGRGLLARVAEANDTRALGTVRVDVAERRKEVTAGKAGERQDAEESRCKHTGSLTEAEPLSRCRTSAVGLTER